MWEKVNTIIVIQNRLRSIEINTYIVRITEIRCAGHGLDMDTTKQHQGHLKAWEQIESIDVVGKDFTLTWKENTFVMASITLI